MRSLTLVAGDHVADLLEDVRQAGGARHLGRRQPPRAHRARRLQCRELGQEDV